MLYVIGVGLYNSKDITLKGLEVAKNCNKIYLESYTSVQQATKDEYEALFDKEIIIADRVLVEQTNQIVEDAATQDVALLIVGSPLFATTHTDIIIRAKERQIPVEIIHNASIFSAIGCCGLYSYAFGRTVSIPYFTPGWRPISFYDNVMKNFYSGLHTLCLLDIKTDENRFMSVNEAIEQILEADMERKANIVNEDTKIFAICRFGTPTQELVYDRVGEMRKRSFGEPLHSIIIPAKLDFVEEELVEALFK